jgi:hypothetical protein
LTPVEVESLVQGAAPAGRLPPDASTRPTVETFRPALGSASTAAIPHPLPTTAAGTSSIAAGTSPGEPSSAAPGTPFGAAPGTPADPSRGQRRTRESLRADTIKLPPPPPRKR